MKELSDLPPLLYYYQEHKDQNLSGAIMYGFKIKNWRPVGDAKVYPGNWIHVINSLQYGAFQILKQCMDEKKLFIFIDNGYINNKLTSDWAKRTYRVVPCAFQHHWSPEVYDGDRYRYLYEEDIEELLKPWNYGHGDHVLIVPQSSWESNALFGLHRWMHKMYDIVQNTGYKGRIEIRQKGTYRRPLELDLLNAQACIAYTSNVAVDAVIHGVPTFCADTSAACNASNDMVELKHLADILYYQHAVAIEPERVAFIRSLICGQFTHTEISNGFALERTMQEMLRRMNANSIE